MKLGTIDENSFKNSPKWNFSIEKSPVKPFKNPSKVI